MQNIKIQIQIQVQVYSLPDVVNNNDIAEKFCVRAHRHLLKLSHRDLKCPKY